MPLSTTAVLTWPARTLTSRVSLWCSFLCLALLSGCDSSSTDPGSVPSQLVLSRTELVLQDGASDSVSVEIRDQSGRALDPLPGGEAVVWSSSDTTVASVQNGVITARRPGSAEVAASLGTLRATATVTVTAVAVDLRVEGDSVRAVPAGAEADPLVVRVVDRHGEGVAGVKVVFSVASGGGSLNADTVTSDTAGLARAIWTPGSQGVPRVTARTGTLPPVGFVAFRVTGEGLARDTVLTTPFETYAVWLSGTFLGPHPIAAVSYVLDGGQEQKGGASAKFSSFGMDLVLPKGVHTLRVTVVDSAGLRGSWQRTIEVRDLPTRSYSLTFLGTGGTDSGATDLDERGEVVGWIARAVGDTAAVLWNSTGAVMLGEGLGTWSRATGINKNGEIVGRFRDGSCARSFHWRSGARTLLDGCDLSASGISDRGTILFEQNVVLRDGQMIDVAATSGLPTQARATGYKINNNDAVLTVFWPGSGCSGGGCSFGPMVIRPPYSASDATIYGGRGWPAGLNDLGDVVGTCAGGSSEGSCSGRILLTDGASYRINWYVKANDSFGTQGGASAINNLRQVVGTVRRSQDGIGPIPYLWEAGTVFRIRTDSTAWVLDSVTAINDRGQIVGHAYNSTTGQKGAVLLTPS